MTKETVFEALMQGDAAEIALVAKLLRKKVVHDVVKPPTRELVMFQMEESVEKIDFNVGEILVTSAEVRVGDTLGYGMVMDLDEQKALDCALLMAIYEAGLPEADQIATLANRLITKMTSRMRQEREIVSSTRVNFEVMGGQDPNVNHDLEASD